VVLVTGAVEDDRLDAQGPGALGHELADPAGGADFMALDLDLLNGLLEGRGRAQRVTDGVVDELGHHVAIGAGDDQTRALRGTADALAHALVAQPAGDRL